MPESPAPSDPRKYLDPRVLSKLGRLEIKARLIVEGFITGLHRSPYRGFSIEFAEHREYVPGDDIRHVDWKVFGRSDRYYIKQYEEETNLKAYILVDASESMAYPAVPGKDSGAISKYEYATYIAASLAYLLLRQQDAVGLALFDDRVRSLVPPSSNPSHLTTLLGPLDNPGLQQETNVGSILHEFADRVKKKSLIIVISDLLDDVPRLTRGLKHLRYRKHDVMVLHVLARDELQFPFQRMTLFEGMEGFADQLANPSALRDAYLAELNGYLAEVRKICRDDRIDYALLDTEEKLDVPLSAFLAMRAASQKT
jgi:uncharacterized protein (DUF58 family)